MKTFFLFIGFLCSQHLSIAQATEKKVLELVTIEIKEDTNKEFEAAIVKAKTIISRAKGFISYEAKHCLEQENKYIFLIYWESVEAHMKGFRESDLYKEYRSFLLPFFKNPPSVQHFN
ncbi:antibiotic biosynthesis monooxygenase [Emticicia sp. BO119]|uniref:antibiotic biosynthesis monooxygenase family protein n=1 Tax=Emticicia sp. BO119 TaxID=2757768 RepID=UPI0015F116D1|nr:antibiotic biosynthesis monooxygenase family protein [Emticicia sp. BO119]MBA4849114.1 antibiotic biosynthesis monooxygenase [Emticicia sp. BO119]